MSRKIDALVAEHVMELEPVCVHRCGDRIQLTGLIKHYSTDISAAWEVVEKVKGYDRVEIFNDDGFWFVSIDTHDKFDQTDGHVVPREMCDTAPMAICLAALKAKGIEVEDEMPKKETT